MSVISIIVPVYKVEKTVSKCIQSIVNQSFMDFELLLIDDGSPDHSGEICDEWAKKDKRITVFHQINQGVSAARNKGLELASGDYICFVDSDDWVKEDYLINLFKMSSKNAQNRFCLVINGFVRTNTKGDIITKKGFKEIVFNADCFRELFVSCEIMKFGYPWSKLYNRSLIEQNGLKFDEKISCCEDLIFMLEYLLCCDCVVYGEGVDYVYVKYDTSLSIVVNSFESEYACFMKLLYLMDQIKQQYCISIAEMETFFDTIMMCFRRVLKTDYLNYHNVPMRTRITHLKILLSKSDDIFDKYYMPSYKMDKVGKFILKRKMFFLYDILVKNLFRFKFKYMYLSHS